MSNKVVPARLINNQPAPAKQPIAIPEAVSQEDAEDNQHRHRYIVSLENKIAERDRKLEAAACAIANERFEKEFIARENEKLQIQNRELIAANNVFKMNESVRATTALAEVERVRDACVQAVKDVIEAGRLHSDMAASRIKDIHEVTAAAMKRLFDSSTNTIEEALEHALRAGLTLEAESQPEQDDGAAEIARKLAPIAYGREAEASAV